MSGLTSGDFDVDADRGGEFARRQHVLHLLAGLDRHHVGGRLVFGDVLVARQHPGDLAEIDAVFVLQDAARPDAGGDRIAAVDADPLAFEVLRTGDAGLGVDQNRAVMERPHDEHRDRRHRLAVRFGADVGRDRHLADVELVAPHHAAERRDDRIDLFECEHARLRLDGAVLQRLVVALRTGDGLELEVGHWTFLSQYFSSSRTRNLRARRARSCTRTAADRPPPPRRPA